MAKRMNGEGSWGTKMIKGKKYYRYSKTYPEGRKDFYGKTKKEVDEKVIKYEDDRKDKEVVFVPTNIELFGQYALDYVHNIAIKTISGRTPGDYEDIINNRVIPNECILGNLQLNQITHQYLDDYIKFLVEDKKYSHETIVKTIRVVKHALEYGIKEGKINLTQSDLDDFKAPSQNAVLTPKREIPFLSKEDMERVYKEAKKDKYGSNGWCLILIMYTGVRMGELQELRWKDVDTKKNTITINRTLIRKKTSSSNNGTKYEYVIKENPKTPSGRRTIPLSKKAQEAIQFFDQLNPKHTKGDLVCITSSNNHSHKNGDNLRRSLQSVLKNTEDCSVEQCGLHALRHSFGSCLLEDGIDIKVVSILMGHKKVTTTYDYYIHIIKNRLVESVKIFDE